MKIYEGKEEQYVPQRKTSLTPIAVIEVSENELIYVIEGEKGQRPESDILIRYSHGDNYRTPKHAHWAVDLLLKKENNEKLTKEFINELKKEWEKCKPLNDREFITIKTIVNKSQKFINDPSNKKYKTLSQYGEYDIDFLIVILVLLMYQEKTSSDKAELFINILNKLTDDKIDIYGIISGATYRGGNN